MNRKRIQCKNISRTVSVDEGSVEEGHQSNREYVARYSSTPSHVDVGQVADDREYVQRNSSSSSDMSFHEDPHDCDDNVHCEEDFDTKTIVNDEDDVDTDRDTSSSNSPNTDFIAAARRFDNLEYYPYDPKEGRKSGSDRDINVHIDEDVMKDDKEIRTDVDVYSNEDVEVQAGGKEDDEYGEQDISTSRNSDIDVDIDEEENNDCDLVDPDKVINWLKQIDIVYNRGYRDRSPLNFSDRKLYEEGDEDYKDRQLSTTHDCEHLDHDVPFDPDSFNCDVKQNVDMYNKERKTLDSFDNMAVEDVDENTIEIVAPNGDMNDGVNVGGENINIGPNEDPNIGVPEECLFGARQMSHVKEALHDPPMH